MLHPLLDRGLPWTTLRLRPYPLRIPELQLEKKSPLREPSPGEPPQEKHAKYVANSGREFHDPAQVEASPTGPGVSAEASKPAETAEDMVIPTYCMSI